MSSTGRSPPGTPPEDATAGNKSLSNSSVAQEEQVMLEERDSIMQFYKKITGCGYQTL